MIIIFVVTAECTFLAKILQYFSGINMSQPRFIGRLVYIDSTVSALSTIVTVGIPHFILLFLFLFLHPLSPLI